MIFLSDLVLGIVNILEYIHFKSAVSDFWFSYNADIGLLN